MQYKFLFMLYIYSWQSYKQKQNYPGIIDKEIKIFDNTRHKTCMF